MQLGVLLYMGVAFALPLLPHIVVSETGWAAPYGLASTLAAIAAHLSLFTPIGYAFDKPFFQSWLELKGLGVWLCLVFHLDAGLAFLLVFFRVRRKLPLRELS